MSEHATPRFAREMNCRGFPLLNSQLLVLASSSIFRSELLKRLQLPFEAMAPNVDETPLPNESARTTSVRLAQEKALAVAGNYPDALIIGSDQVALLEGRQLGKPITHDNAVKQLRAMRGKTTHFYTALALLNSKTGNMQIKVAENFVSLRDLSDAEIEGYLQKEQPYHCAGSAKAEGLGIALIDKMTGEDPNALIGLPLILLVQMLRSENVLLF
jgi:7-methyl-GTP pyrophosphatase